MSKTYRHKIIIDPVHGDIGLSELEVELINSSTFQRLRKLKQLGFASTVYPNASHSRFAHSLGVLYVTYRVIELFQRKEKLTSDEDIQKLRAAALLHDIGHYPYSHLMELIDWDSYISDYLEKGSGHRVVSSPQVAPYPKHEKLGRLIITKRADIKGILEKHSIDPVEIAALIGGEHTFIPNLLHMSLDVDRMDYLLRDSLNTGVPYGQIDINYILNNLDVTEENEIVLDAKARISAEHLLLSRYFMFNAVYFHKTVFGFEEVVRKIILLLLKEKDGIYKTGKEIENIVEAENSWEFLDFHDGYIDKFIDEYARKESDEPLPLLCNAIRQRKPPQLIHEVVDLYYSHNNPSRKYVEFERCMKKELDDIASKCHISTDCLIWRETKDVKFEALNPFTGLSKARDAKEEEIRELVRIQEKNGDITNLIENNKSIIYYLSQLILKVSRLYAVVSDSDKENGKVEKIRKEVETRL